MSLSARHLHPLLTEVRAWREYLPYYLPLPHPSPRNLMWFRRNPWFEREVATVLREKVHALLSAETRRIGKRKKALK